MNLCFSIANAIEILEIVSWPVTALILAFFVRKPIASLIPFIQKIKLHGAEIEFFSESLKQIENDISDDPIVKESATATDNKIRNAFRTSPDYSIMAVWNTLELSVRNRVEKLLPDDETFKNPLERPIEYLEFKGALTPKIAGAIRDLRTLRNQIAHFGADMVSREDAFQFAQLATVVGNAIDKIVELPKVKLTALTLLILELNQLIDSGNFNDISIDDVYHWIETESIIPSLAARAEGTVDLSPVRRQRSIFKFFEVLPRADEMYFWWLRR